MESLLLITAEILQQLIIKQFKYLDNKGMHYQQCRWFSLYNRVTGKKDKIFLIRTL